MSPKGESSKANDKLKVVVRSSDNAVFMIKKEVATKLQTIALCLEDLEDPDEVILLPQVKSSILRMVIEYCELQVDDKEDDEYANMRVRVVRNDPFGDQLRHAHLWVLFYIVEAAIYLNVTGLFDLGTYIVAYLLKDKSEEEIFEMLHNKKDNTPKEEDVRKGNSHSFDK